MSAAGSGDRPLRRIAPGRKRTATQPFTDEDLLRLPQDGRKYELVDGEIRVSPAGARHGQIGVRLAARLFSFVSERGLGHAFASSTGFRWPGRKAGEKNLRSPDMSFVAVGRFPDEQPPVGFVQFAPDLAVEILSPEDRRRDVLEKVGEYLDAARRWCGSSTPSGAAPPSTAL